MSGPRVVALFALATAGAAPLGCNDLTAGIDHERLGAPRLVRVMVQDEGWRGGLGRATDLLDTGGGQACSDTDPCPSFFKLANQLVTFTCDLPAGASRGTCFDPLSARTPPTVGLPVKAGGNQIRLVFDQLLTHDLEVDSGDPKAPYRLRDGVVAIVDAQGAEVPVVTSYDPSGSFEVTSDPIWNPYGPALVLVTKTQLSPLGRYAVVLHSRTVENRRGDRPVNADDVALPDPYRIDFTMGGIELANLAPELRGMPLAQLQRNDVLSFSFQVPVDAASVTANLMGPGGAVALEAWSDVGHLGAKNDPTKCDQVRDPRQLNLAPVSAPGKTIDLAAGSYTLQLSVRSQTGGASYASGALQFTVANSRGDPKSDAQARENFLLPEECTH